ncbi:MAG: ribonuclease III [Parvibaculum sp.]|nr:ribonuclease III [Parvibaculum sp.]
MSPNPASSVAALEARLGHRFANDSVLHRALRHSSAIARNETHLSNERLEFMGDRVLGLVVAEWLMRDFPDAVEGELAVRYNGLVRKETCADVAERIGLGEFLVLGAGEDRAGGRKKPAILADACEAVIAALYLDGGLEPARRFIETEWARFLSEPTQRVDAKTSLQEWSQKRGRGIPVYNATGRSGPDHAPSFEVQVEISGLKPLSGSGSSKRIAEQAAARAMLLREKVWNEND